jgi:multiple sugar transport system permease protein
MMATPSTRQSTKPRSFWNEANREALTAYLFLLPFIATLIVFFGYAFVRTVYFSFTDYNLFEITKLVGLENYVKIFSDQLFRIALANTVIYSLVTTALQTFGALVLAVVLNQKLHGMAFFRTAYYMPSITSSVVITLIFIWLFRPTGIISFFGNWLTNHGALVAAFLVLMAMFQALQVVWERSQKLPAGPFDPVLLLSSAMLALVGVFILNLTNVIQVGTAPAAQLTWISTRERFLGLIPFPLVVIIIQNVFTTIPTMMLFFLAGLQGLSKSLYEASSLDGATPWQQLRFITIPMLRPVTFYVVTLSVIGTLQLFDQVSLFEGANAPLESTVTLAFYVFRNVFKPDNGGLPQIGMASAAAIVLATITIIIVIIQRRFVVSDSGN